MKKQMFAAICFMIVGSVSAQSEFLERQKTKAKEKSVTRLENKIDNGMDKTLDKADKSVSGVGKKKEKKEKTVDSNSTAPSESTTNSPNGNSQEGSSGTNNSGNKEAPTTGSNSGNSSTSGSNNQNQDIKIYSKFDFVSGEKVIGYDDFSNASVGDFPVDWNTNASGEVVTIDDSGQKWLIMSSDGYFQPDFIQNMPDNFTLEFEVFTRYRSNNILRYQIHLASCENPKAYLSESYLSDDILFEWAGGETTTAFFVTSNGEVINKNDGFIVKDFLCQGDNHEQASKVKMSIWRQGTRLRIYVNQNKVLDIPKAFDPAKTYNVFKLGGRYMNYAEAENKDEFLVSNLRYAAGAPDTRSKLITEGKLVSRGILFEVNSDKIKQESYGSLKDIAKVLIENPEVKVKIVGHTDADGESEANLVLSKKRAEAVKSILISEFGIPAVRLESDGKGEIEPTDSNSTSIGKANNRRVEFIKL